MNPWLSIVGGGLVSVLITIGFNVYWDRKKQQLLEDWEFRRYHANQIHVATLGSHPSLNFSFCFTLSRRSPALSPS